MLDWLSRLLGRRSAVEERRGNPALVATVQKSAEIYEQIPLKQFIDRDTSDRLARQFYLEINSVCNAADPLMVGREKLAGTMLRFALYQVLTIPSAPAEDSSGLRGLPGISGEFRPHLDVLAQKNISLRSELAGYSGDSAETALNSSTDVVFTAAVCETDKTASV